MSSGNERFPFVVRECTTGWGKLSVMGEEEGRRVGSGESDWDWPFSGRSRDLLLSGCSGRRDGLLLLCFSRGVRTSCLLTEDVLGRSSDIERERLFLERLLNFRLFLILSTSRPTSKVLRDMMGEGLVVQLGKVSSKRPQESMESSTEYFFRRGCMEGRYFYWLTVDGRIEKLSGSKHVADETTSIEGELRVEFSQGSRL